MPLLRSILCAGALFVASPALAQDNNAAPANAVSSAPEMNATSNTDQNLAATAPSVAPTAESGPSAPAGRYSGFPWGVLGLLGLIGLFGVRKAKAEAQTCAGETRS